jgi:hypothetical protein
MEARVGRFHVPGVADCGRTPHDCDAPAASPALRRELRITRERSGDTPIGFRAGAPDSRITTPEIRQHGEPSADATVRFRVVAERCRITMPEIAATATEMRITRIQGADAPP